MRWRRLGRIWAPDGTLPWARAHAMLPTPLPLPDGRLRVLLACTDAQTVSRIGWVDLDGDDPRRVVGWAREPVLDIGAPGRFDDNGVNPCSVLALPDGRVRLWYVGYQLQRQVPYTLFTGVAEAERPDGPFRRLREVPVLDRAEGEPFFRTAPCVMPQPGGGFACWYIGGGEFHEVEGRMQPRYALRHATSADGLAWSAPGRVLMEPGPGELGFGRPWLVPEGQGWRLWYSVRGPKGYGLGTAVSPDGLRWERRDAEAGLAPAPGEWDGEMVCYAAVTRIGGTEYMLYNGNGYGRTGLGLAVRDDG